jgi:hypothetical protein
MGVFCRLGVCCTMDNVRNLYPLNVNRRPKTGRRFFVKNTRNLLETHSLSRINNVSSRLTEKSFMYV